MSAVLGVAVKVIVVICVLWFIAGVAFVAKCLAEVAWDHRNRPVLPHPGEISATRELKAPTDAEINRAIDDYYKQNGGRPSA